MEKIEMVVSKKNLCKKIIKVFIQMNIAFIGGFFILFFIVSLFNQGSLSFFELVGLSLLGGLPMTMTLGPFIVIGLIKGLKSIAEQEKFYEIEFDEDVKNIMMENLIYEGSDWYIEMLGLQFVVFKNGFITRFEKYKKSGKKMATVTAVCADGKRRRLGGSASSIARLRKWVGRCRKQEKTSS